MSRRELKKILSLSAMVVSVLTLAFVPTTFAANTPTLNQTINAGVLSTDILDASQAPVASPSFSMSAKNTAFTCQSGGSASTGSLGANAQRLYVINPGAATNGWTLTMAATSGATAVWTSGGNTFDFNDAGGSGCTDSADTDTKGGQLTVDPSVGTITADCASCTTTNVTKGSSTGFVEGTTNSITLMTASASAESVWRGYLTGASLSQTIPAETPGGTYTLNMTLTATAS
jgi:hypothetical protein